MENLGGARFIHFLTQMPEFFIKNSHISRRPLNFSRITKTHFSMRVFCLRRKVNPYSFQNGAIYSNTFIWQLPAEGPLLGYSEICDSFLEIMTKMDKENH